MAGLLSSSAHAARPLRAALTTTTAPQSSTSTRPENALAARYGATTRPALRCRAGRRGYRDFSNASDWSGLFQSLADMSKAFETAATETGPDGSFKRRQRGAPDEDGPIDAESEDVEAPLIVPVDVEEYAEGYNLYMDVPGLQKSDVKIQVFPEQRMITISGERKRVEAATGQNASGRRFRRRYERRTGKFSRSLRLAKDLDIKTISARVEKGVLHVAARKVPVANGAADAMEIDIQ